MIIGNSSSPDLSVLDRYWVTREPIRPSVMPNEHLLLISDEHWIKYVFPLIVYAILTAAGLALSVGFFFAALDGQVSMLAFSIGLLLLTCTHHWFFWFLLAESQVDIIVTSKRVVYAHAGLLWDEDIVEVAFEKMKTVEAHKKSLLQSVLNYGTLNFEKKAQIARVPHPGTVARIIQQAIGMI